MNDHWVECLERIESLGVFLRLNCISLYLYSKFKDSFYYFNIMLKILALINPLKSIEIQRFLSLCSSRPKRTLRIGCPSQIDWSRRRRLPARFMQNH
jgi:hypothetical protein